MENKILLGYQKNQNVLCSDFIYKRNGLGSFFNKENVITF